jgi:aspartyl-tRNA(Asn)/glutamyl-tRNA(Gln) amidotransferase subunit A
MPPPSHSISSLRAALASRQTSAEALTRAALDRATSLNPTLNAFLQLLPEAALAAARALDARLASGEQPPPLAGIPLALKDNLCLGPEPELGGYGGRTTCASRILESYESPYTATAAARLIRAGAIVIGKTNLDEFAMGSSGEHSAFGPTRNPWDTTRVPGGSSAGSAAAVASGIVPVALGSDTGGSIRQPAGLCGIVGLKPTYGRISRYGLVAFASSLDQIGPLTRTVADAAAILNVICGEDPLDSTSSPHEVPDFTRGLETPVEKLVIGVPRQARSPANHPAVNAALDNAISIYRRLGATVVDIDLPRTEEGIAAYYIIAPAEASSNLARYDGIRYGRRGTPTLRGGAPSDSLMDLYCRTRAEGFGPEVQRRIMLGTYVLSAGYYDAYYLTALKARRLIKADYDAAFGTDRATDLSGSAERSVPPCHAILMPSSPTPAFKLGEKSADPLSMYLEDLYTVGVNLAGLPAITIPGGFANETGTPLPVGLQLIAPPWEESRLLRLARMLERETGLSGHIPPISGQAPAPALDS